MDPGRCGTQRHGRRTVGPRKGASLHGGGNVLPEGIGDWLVVLHVRLDNESDDVPGNDDYTGYGPSVFDALHVDQVSVGSPDCFGENRGESNLAPGEGAIARVGFISSFDPTDAALMLETDGPLFIEIAPGT